MEGVFAALARAYGEQGWWPGDTPFEIMVGAVLTQNTAWRNVEYAIGALAEAQCLEPEHIAALPPATLAALIRPAGYYNIKARRLQNLCGWLEELGGIAALSAYSTLELRARLLEVNGIGPETADAILLYALDREVFVVDAYARRVFSRVGVADGDLPYEALRAQVEAALVGGRAAYAEFHALIVAHGKHACRPRPQCGVCALASACHYARTHSGDTN